MVGTDTDGGVEMVISYFLMIQVVHSSFYVVVSELLAENLKLIVLMEGGLPTTITRGYHHQPTEDLKSSLDNVYIVVLFRYMFKFVQYSLLYWMISNENQPI